MLGHPDLLTPGLLGKVTQQEQGGLDPVKGLAPPLEEQLCQQGGIRVSHHSDHEGFLNFLEHRCPLSMDLVAMSNGGSGPSRT
ncbi:hypothetical protein D3C80_2023800 [compost metagenome]